ncbi:MAG: serine hydrolase [Labilithrix sp.]|nr:serine hydrolase [Labilithrix sp.]
MLRWVNGDVREAVAAFRSLETRDALRLGDPFHIGSTAKSMTATLAAIFVERGSLRWEAPLRSRAQRVEPLPRTRRSNAGRAAERVSSGRGRRHDTLCRRRVLARLDPRRCDPTEACARCLSATIPTRCSTISRAGFHAPNGVV